MICNSHFSSILDPTNPIIAAFKRFIAKAKHSSMIVPPGAETLKAILLAATAWLESPQGQLIRFTSGENGMEGFEQFHSSAGNRFTYVNVETPLRKFSVHDKLESKNITIKLQRLDRVLDSKHSLLHDVVLCSFWTVARHETGDIGGC